MRGGDRREYNVPRSSTAPSVSQARWMLVRQQNGADDGLECGRSYKYSAGSPLYHQAASTDDDKQAMRSSTTVSLRYGQRL